MAPIFRLVTDFFSELKDYLNRQIPSWLKPWLVRGFRWLGMLLLVFVISATGLVQMIIGPDRVIRNGDQAYWKSQFVQARRSYEKALDTARLRPQETLAYARLCRLYRTQGKFAEALSICQAAVQSDLTSSLARAELARLFVALGDVEMGIAQAQEACELDDKEPAAFLALAEAMASYEKSRGSNQFEKPLELAQYAYSLNPSNPEALQTLGYLFQLRGQFEEAYRFYQRANQIFPSFFAYYVDLGSVEQSRMNLRTSFEFYQRALVLYPESLAALQGRGWVWSMMGDYEQAKEDFLQAIRLNPTLSSNWAGLGWVYLRMEKLSEARRAFDQALSLFPEDANALAGLDSLDALALAVIPQAQETVNSPTPSVIAESGELSAETVDANPETPPANGFAEAASAAVMVYAFNDQMDIVSACSGVNINPRGIFLTTAHCLGHRESGILYNGQGLVGIGMVRDFRQPPERLLRARILQADFLLDIAVLEAIGDWQGNALIEDLNLPYVVLGNSDDLQVGEEVWTVGFPGMGGETLTITRGVISGFADREGLPWIKTDLMTGPGNSGGMVLNTDNELIGIHIQSWSDVGEVSSRLSAERPINACRLLLESYLSSPNDHAE